MPLRTIHTSPAGVQAILLATFGVAIALLAKVLAPTYQYLLVPSLQPGALYPSLTAAGGTGFLALGARMSEYTLVALVDPAVTLVAIAIGLLYLVRSALGRHRPELEGLLPRMAFAVILANVTLPIAGAILGLAGSVYPVFEGFDHGAWESWANVTGNSLLQYAWGNGALTLVIEFVLFSLLLLLVAAVAVRNALLGVLLVLLPILTLLYPIPTLRPLARRAWLWFAELAFLPCVMIVPLELSVGSTSIMMTMGYLVVALGAPALLSIAGASLTGAGFPSASGAITGGIQRGLAVATLAAEGVVAPIAAPIAGAGVAGAVGAATRHASSAPAPFALSAFGSHLFGQGTSRLLRHLAGPGKGADGGAWSAPAVRGGRR